MSDQKIILCYTGEPRSFRKSLRNRNKALDRFYKNKYNIQSNYLIYFSPSQNSRNKDLIFNKIKYLGEDKFLNNLILENKKYGENIYKYILDQKYRLLKLTIKSNKLDKNDLIVLTRTDWLFTHETRQLLDISKKDNKITSPFLSDTLYEHFGIKYKALFDQIFVIPGNFAKEMLEALKVAIEYCDDQVKLTNSKNLNAGGNGMNRFGLSPELLLGLGFEKCNLSKSQKSIKFNFSYPANMYNASRNNLLRHDAHIWMNLSLEDIFTKYVIWYLKPFLSIKIKNFLKIFNIRNRK